MKCSNLFLNRTHHMTNSLLLLNSQLMLSTSYGNKWTNHRQRSHVLTAVEDQQTAQQQHKPESWGHRQPGIPLSTPLPKGRSHQSQSQFSSQISLQSGSYRQQLFTLRRSSQSCLASQKRGRNGANVSARSTEMRQQMKKILFAMLCRSYAMC